jgi:hypothetical protein
MTFSEIVASLQTASAGVCEHLVGSASFVDEGDYEQLGLQYDDAVAAFTRSDGTPVEPTPRFPGLDVERAACWRRGDLTLYAVLTFGDNTRIRTLTLGIARRGTVVHC